MCVEHDKKVLLSPPFSVGFGYSISFHFLHGSDVRWNMRWSVLSCVGIGSILVIVIRGPLSFPLCFLQFYFLIFITVREQLGMYSVHCSVTLSAAVRLLEAEDCQFSQFTVLGSLCCTADVPLVPQHGSIRLGLDSCFKVYFSRSTMFC